MSARLVPCVSPLPHRRDGQRLSLAIAPALAASFARVLAARSTDLSWSTPRRAPRRRRLRDPERRF